MPSKIPSNYPSDTETVDRETLTESGYVSGSSSDDALPEVYFTKPHLTFLNRQLQFLEPQGQHGSPLKPVSLHYEGGGVCSMIGTHADLLQMS